MARFVAVISGLLEIALAVVYTVMLLNDHQELRNTYGPPGLLPLVILLIALTGSLLLFRVPRNWVGWILAAVALDLQLTVVIQLYADLAPKIHSFGAAIAGWMSSRLWLPGVLLTLTYLVLLFPNGHLPSRRWRWPARIVGVTVILSIAAWAFDAHGATNLSRASGGSTGLSHKGAIGTLEVLGFLTGFVSIAAPIQRYRLADSATRHQIKWLAFAMVLFVLASAAIPISALFNNPSHPAAWTSTTFVAALGGIPVAIGIAVLKYRLYDIDVVISRTLVYGALAAFITAVYVGIVVGIGSLVGSGGRPNIALSIVATAVVAVAFQPVRERVQKVANRLVYGKRATPYEVLSQFSERVAESYAADDVLPRMARVLADGTGAARADVWLRAGDILRPSASWPFDSAAAEPARVVGDALPEMLDTDRAVEVRHQGELLGALTITKRKGESLTPVEEKLLTDLAGQAGLVLKNVGLTAELLARLEDLRASRQRLVAAQDEERRRLERNLHDGAQQNLVALKVKLGLAEMFAEKDPARAKQTLAELKVDTDEALETLRDLARGIYPPLLADRGLVAALESQARKATLPVQVDASRVGRYSQEVEAAVYFCCLEALQNVQKYAAAQSALVKLNGSESGLTFEVTDDGQGFDGASIKPGAGLTNMTDRIDALGGRLEVSSTQERGTRVHGSLPVLVAVVPA
jgi:signal transduction histidine kinase